MIKNLKDLSYEENVALLLGGYSFAHLCALKDKNLYENYKSGLLDEMSTKQERDIKIISLLEKLGYPMEELGTYLYKEVVAEAYDIVKNLSTREDMEKARNLLNNLNNPFSNFYLWIARDWLEIGLKSFHYSIEKSISKIDDNKIDKEVSYKVFGPNHEDINYGLLAFRLAAYLSNKYEVEFEVKEPQILGLLQSQLY